ncbi:MAG: hypothetical protein H0U56_09375 [Methylibium sp.]|nr:hypothetical protein [Methylibium sp.]
MSDVQPVAGDAREQEIARMLGGTTAGETSLAHARALLDAASVPVAPASLAPAPGPGTERKRQRA